MFGKSDTDQPVANRYGLKKWPRHEQKLNDMNLWASCLQESPQLLERFRATDSLDLHKFHGVGVRLDDEKNEDVLSTEQALILGYMKVDAGDSLSVSILQSKLEDLIKNGPVSLPSVVKYSKALTIAAQLEMEHGEAAVQLDLDPTPCDEAALVQDFIDTAPKPNKAPK